MHHSQITFLYDIMADYIFQRFQLNYLTWLVVIDYYSTTSKNGYRLYPTSGAFYVELGLAIRQF